MSMEQLFTKKLLALLLLAVIGFSTGAFASEKTLQAVYPFAVEPLPYTTNALAPEIDAQTMEIHHGKHLQAYVDNLNKGLSDHVAYQDKSLEWLLTHLKKLPKPLQPVVRNNGGGLYNHTFFFAGLGKDTTLEPTSRLGVAIREQYGSQTQLLDAMKQAALSQFGSGWAWLVSDSQGRLKVLTTPNQDPPNLNKYTPILAVDVWEHAYYLTYQNKRADYLDAWTNIINWQVAQDIYLGVTDPA